MHFSRFKFLGKARFIEGKATSGHCMWCLLLLLLSRSAASIKNYDKFLSLLLPSVPNSIDDGNWQKKANSLACHASFFLVR